MLNEGLYRFVLYEGEAAKRYHQELFSLPDSGYFAIEGAVTDAVLEASGRFPGELHISAQWETVILLASWNAGAPTVKDVLNLFGEAGIGEFAGMEESDVRAIFSLICRSGRFDLLRRVCRAAKSKAESMCGEKILVHCHLVSDEAGKIIASSL
jgi:hypothetical protein